MLVLTTIQRTVFVLAGFRVLDLGCSGLGSVGFSLGFRVVGFLWRLQAKFNCAVCWRGGAVLFLTLGLMSCLNFCDRGRFPKLYHLQFWTPLILQLV